MTPSEKSERHRPADTSTPEEGFALVAKPYERPQFTETPDGGFTLFLKGEIYVAYRPPAQEVPESPIPTDEEQSGSQLPDSTSPPVTEPHSTADTSSKAASPAEEAPAPENENRKYELVGNPVRDPSFRVRKSGKQIADFVLATHPEEEKTEYWRIRAFDKQAERVRDQVRKGQTGVAVTVYGPKQWKGRKKTKEGSWEETTVTGYYAGFVTVPKRYREESQGEPAS